MGLCTGGVGFDLGYVSITVCIIISYRYRMPVHDAWFIVSRIMHHGCWKVPWPAKVSVQKHVG